MIKIRITFLFLVPKLQLGNPVLEAPASSNYNIRATLSPKIANIYSIEHEKLC